VSNMIITKIAIAAGVVAVAAPLILTKAAHGFPCIGDQGFIGCDGYAVQQAIQHAPGQAQQPPQQPVPLPPPRPQEHSLGAYGWSYEQED
jgi:hypothetical protein